MNTINNAYDNINKIRAQLDVLEASLQNICHTMCGGTTKRPYNTSTNIYGQSGANDPTIPAVVPSVFGELETPETTIVKVETAKKATKEMKSAIKDALPIAIEEVNKKADGEGINDLAAMALENETMKVVEDITKELTKNPSKAVIDEDKQD